MLIKKEEVLDSDEEEKDYIGPRISDLSDEDGYAVKLEPSSRAVSTKGCVKTNPRLTNCKSAKDEIKSEASSRKKQVRFSKDIKVEREVV